MDQRLALPVEMAFHAVFSRVWVSAAQCFQDLPMFAHGFIETVRFVKLLVPIKGDLLPQPAQDVVQNTVAGQFLNQDMQNVVDGNVFFTVAFRVVVFKLLVQPLDPPPSNLGHILNGQPGAGSLQHTHDFEHLFNFSHRWLPNVYASMGEKFYEALGFENPQSFPKWGSAHTDLFT